MTRAEFVRRATRAEEKRLEIPAGWWGTWRDVEGPRGVRVRFTGSRWVVRRHGSVISRHDVRAGAIKKARSLS